MTKFILPAVFGAAVSFLSTPIVKKLAYKLGAIDVPKDDRRVHKKPIPRLGGLAIFLGFLISILALLKINLLEINKEIVGMLVGASIMVVMGLIDDIKPLSARVKLLVQIIAAVVIIGFGIKIEYITNFLKSDTISFLGNETIKLSILSIPITIFWVVGITNTVNLIDGLDGLAAGISAIAALTLAYVAYAKPELSNSHNTMILTLALAGSCIGFLPFNFNPAKIFMGDTGSLFLGYILAAISINGFIKGATALAMVVPVFALGLPIFDTTFAILRRAFNGRPIMQADKGHLHHILLSIGMGQKRAVLTLYMISSFLGVSAALLLKQKYVNSAIMLVITAAMVAVPINQTWMQKHKASNNEELKIKN
ncbi:MraY family glycosyltransferase [Paramaledivibacter caminithermalis]|jgi:UDP-GlcNAc:undecaprenyl-phosphate GlcNAc-1-phosphate transferase|uniref:UDP-GlcNAc:undecaprenyl-phosphate GlcNAc-1-phosphate transferase n=1 Tax=Paramaledivibacter caminithermalis (strain DSM 15212 / CIP 107654 / DViRD3) TaxID=1121301 RepID=A0A1M6L2Q1_PARC5|nr:MraY family glycosyltransferase [Paramaledivibacter caminithermalis]SHJ65467.1 UDP-GlcNAc:undecaprenyl-phosphate GlcNAc-1-phosphate transferase [Paramaledivibacter caminithermalis DSM 15212]